MENKELKTKLVDLLEKYNCNHDDTFYIITNKQLDSFISELKDCLELIKENDKRKETNN